MTEPSTLSTTAHDALPEDVDVIVIGAGAAGCVLAARLSEDPDLRVLLLEAGAPLEGPEFTTPGAAAQLLASETSWGDLTVPQAALGGRRVPLAVGKGLGGSAAINYMSWFRGSPLDYDGWRDAGAAGWGWDDVLPAFRRTEHFSLGPDAYHGAGGPMVISPPRHVGPLATAFVAAGAEQGEPLNPDFNGAVQDGVGPVQNTIRDGARHSVVDGYLKPALGRANLTVATGAAVERLLLDGPRATGVRLAGGREVRAERAVVLAAGALRSPQLLLLSGIGPGEHLREIGVAMAHDLPGVGQNLHDQPAVFAAWPVHAGTPTLLDGQQEAVQEYGLLRSGPLAAFSTVVAMLRSDANVPAPDLQVFPVALGLGPGLVPLPDPAVTCAIILLTPQSRGTVRLASADPAEAPLVDPRYLSAAEDRERLLGGLGRVRTLFEAPALAAITGPSLFPPPDADRAALDAYLTERATTFWHPVGTCRMGTGEGAVVGPDLAVRGLAGLYVADASVMPTVPRGNTQAPTIMIAERAAEMLRSKLAAG